MFRQHVVIPLPLNLSLLKHTLLKSRQQEQVVVQASLARATKLFGKSKKTVLVSQPNVTDRISTKNIFNYLAKVILLVVAAISLKQTHMKLGISTTDQIQQAFVVCRV